jgi:hypothetical protein
MTKLFRFALARLSEGSTIRGGIMLLTACGITLRPELQSAIIATGMTLAGLIGVLVSDAAPASPAE